MERPHFTLWLILLGFFFIDFTRGLLFPNLVTISHFYFGSGTFEGIEIGLLFTAQLGASAIACLIFGILADRRTRKKIVLIALIIWLLGLLLIILAINYYMLLLGQLLLGFGSGGYIPVTQAIIGDAAPKDQKGQIYGWSSILWITGFFMGILLASVTSPNWQLPFLIASVPLVVLAILYWVKGTSFKIGRQDEALKEAYDENKHYVYDYRLTWKSFKGILQNKTNLLVFIEGIFSVFGVTMILLYFFPFLEESPANISPLVVGLIMIIIIVPANLGGVVLWGKIGDRLVGKFPRIRVLLIALCFSVTIPLFIAAFWVKGSPAVETNTLWAAFSNPRILLFIILFALAEFLVVIYEPNQPPIINAINLPEIRGSVFALNRFIEELGGALGPLVIGIIFEATAQDYSLAMTIGMLFIIPGAICWWIIMKTYLSDHSSVQKILVQRAQSNKNRD